MTWAPTEIQKTIYETLSTDETLLSMVTGIFDSGAIPEYTQFPYITIGNAPLEQRSNHTWRGWRSDLQIDVWYQESGRGRKKVQEIQAQIDALLDNKDICIDGWNIVNLRTQMVDVIIDSDNVTLHGIQIFNLLLGEA